MVRLTRNLVRVIFVVLAVIALTMIIFRRKPEGLCPADQLQAGSHCCPKDDNGLQFHVVGHHCEDQYGNTYHGTSEHAGGGKAYGGSAPGTGLGADILNASRAASECVKQGGKYDYTNNTCGITWGTCNYYGRGFENGKCLAPGTGQNKTVGKSIAGQNSDVSNMARIIATGTNKKCAKLGGAYSNGKCRVTKDTCTAYGRSYAGNGVCGDKISVDNTNLFKADRAKAVAELQYKKDCKSQGYDTNIRGKKTCRCWSGKTLYHLEHKDKCLSKDQARARATDQNRKLLQAEADAKKQCETPDDTGATYTWDSHNKQCNKNAPANEGPAPPAASNSGPGYYVCTNDKFNGFDNPIVEVKDPSKDDPMTLCNALTQCTQNGGCGNYYGFSHL